MAKHDHAARVDDKLRAFDRCVADVAATRTAELWNPIIHNPGWTTVVEVLMFEQAIETATRQVQAAHQQMNAALEAAKQVGRN